MTPWVMCLIGANALMYLLAPPGTLLFEQLALVPAWLKVHPWTAFTYMFLHAGFSHLFFNMLALYMFGPPVEARLGGRRFAILYFAGGITGALLSVLTSQAAVVGASGATYGVMLGFAWYWPRQQIMLWGIFGVEARWLVVIFTVISLMGVGGGGIAHFAHLGGFVGAWLYLRWLGERPKAAAAAWKKKSTVRVSGSGNSIERWKKINAAALHPVNREEYERVIKKLDAQGGAALTDGEREFLDRFSNVT
jgi:membrane associated rhomboid family serine protease